MGEFQAVQLQLKGLRRHAYPADQQRWGIALGAVMMVTIIAGFISPKTLAYSGPAVAAAFIAAGLVRHRARSARSGMLISLAAFFAFAALSAAWSIEPGLALLKTLIGAGIALASFAAFHLIVRESAPNSQRLAEGLWLGVLVGALYLLIEVLSDQSLMIVFINALGLKAEQLKPSDFYFWKDGKLAGIFLSDLNRNVATFTLLLPAALLASISALARPWRHAVAASLMALALVTVFKSGSETSKLALITGSGAAIAAFVSTTLARRGLMIAWVFACTMSAVLPYVAYHADLQKSEWLAKKLEGASPGARLNIAHAYAEHILEAPILGHGANMSYVLGPKFDGESSPEDQRAGKGMGPHPHNVYLQVWFELGLVGVALFTTVGLMMLRSFRDLAGEVQPFAYATFAAGATVIATSWGMWQYWLMGLYGLAALALAIAIGNATARPDETP